MRSINEYIINGRLLKDILTDHEEYLYHGGSNTKVAIVHNVNLNWIDLHGIDLTGADFTGCLFQEADLRFTNFKYARLQGANFAHADLYGANLQMVNLQGAFLRNAKNILEVGPIGSRASMLYAVKHTDSIMISCGCFWDNLNVFTEAVNRTHGENYHGKSYQAAIELIKVVLGDKNDLYNQ